MKITKNQLLLFSFLFISLVHNSMYACSMYKLTANGKTMVGCNYDTWHTTPKLWFKNAKSSDEYGACFNGARALGNNRTAPNSGMNEAGLVFARLASYYPIQKNPFTDRAKITNEGDYVEDILHTCASIEEVKSYIQQYDHSRFIEQVFIYIDTTGKYLIVEPYELIEGEDAHYVLSNFCPSITSNETARTLVRYKNGEDFLNSHPLESTLAYCAAVSDTMSVCRSRNGDGTLLSSIYDSKDKMLNLYFYHAFDTVVQYSLAEELAKGDHMLDIPEQFPENKEFERLKNYITPFNTPSLRVAFLVLGGVLTLFSFLVFVYILLNRKTQVSNSALVFPIVMNVLLTIYLAILFIHKPVYYMDAPFQHHSSKLISASSYIPFILLLLFIPISFLTIEKCKSDETRRWFKTLLASNNLVYLVLLVAFGYWGLYSVWY